MTQQNNPLAISTNGILSNKLLSLNNRLEQAARHNVSQWLENNPHQSFTITEKRAMVKLEQLKLAGDLTLAEIILRGEIIREIEAHGLWSSHPMGYSSMEEAAEAQGISTSEYSNIRDLTETIFPYLVNMGYNIAELWEDIGKSNFRELVPILKRSITEQVSRSNRVEQIFENEMNDIFATASAQGEQITTDTARQILITQLLEAGQLPVRALRQRIRPDRTHALEAYRLPYRNDRNVVMMVADADQIELLNRRMSGYIDMVPVSEDDMRHSPMLRELGQYLQGE